MFFAYSKYHTEMNKVKSDATDIYFYLQERRLLHAFGKILVQKNLSPKSYSFDSSCCKVLFTSTEGFGKFTTFIKYKQYLVEFNKHYTL